MRGQSDQKLAGPGERLRELKQKLSFYQSELARAVGPDEKYKLETGIEDLQAEIRPLELARNAEDARRMERNGAFAEALAAWEEIREADPDQRGVDEQVRRLREKTALGERILAARKGLQPRLREITDVYPQVAKRLGQLAQTADKLEAESYVDVVESFLAEDVSADDFRALWNALDADPPAMRGDGPNYSVLAERLQRGEIAILLGSDVPSLFGAADVLDARGLARTLAEEASYEDSDGSLPKICEYYEITERGKPSLVRKLDPLLPRDVDVPLYSALARLDTPLVLVSTAYDTLLEQALRNERKKFAVISAIVPRRSSDTDWRFLVRYSDRDKPKDFPLGESLSELDLLNAGYSVIHKVRGCVERDANTDPHQHTMMLSEKSYFDFAASRGRLVPDYFVRQLKERGFLLLGCVPRQWEDRLVLRTLLDKRQNASEQPLTVRDDVDDFENAFWSRRGVRRYAVSLPDFVRSLEVHLG